MDRVLHLIETWGFPRQGSDWLRRRRLLVIAALAVLSWCLLAALGYAVYVLLGQSASLFMDLVDPSQNPASTTR